jgi:hypothetical protein
MQRRTKKNTELWRYFHVHSEEIQTHTHSRRRRKTSLKKEREKCLSVLELVIIENERKERSNEIGRKKRKKMCVCVFALRSREREREKGLFLLDRTRDHVSERFTWHIFESTVLPSKQNQSIDQRSKQQLSERRTALYFSLSVLYVRAMSGTNGS